MPKLSPYRKSNHPARDLGVIERQSDSVRPIRLKENCVRVQREASLSHVSLGPIDAGRGEIGVSCSRIGSSSGPTTATPSSDGRVIPTFRSPTEGSDWTINCSHGS